MKSPVVIGATGGSGTRALRAVLEAYGAFMGVNLLPTGDAVDFFQFYNTFLNPTMWATRSLNYRLSSVPMTIREPAVALLRECLAHYCDGVDTTARPWGMKGPRSMYMLPYLHHLMPSMTFLHLVRDGRDMALSGNLGQVERHYRAVFGKGPGQDMEVAAARLWAKANIEANLWCRSNLPAHHLVVRYEDVRTAPVATISRILDFLGWSCTAEKCDQLAQIIKPVENIERWRGLSSARQAVIADVARPGLTHFGYLSEG